MYENLTVVKLRKELKSRGLSTGGVKRTLIARLEEDDGTGGSPPKATPTRAKRKRATRAKTTTTTTSVEAPPAKRQRATRAKKKPTTTTKTTTTTTTKKTTTTTTAKTSKNNFGIPVDEKCPAVHCSSVVDEFACTLNQTNIANNNNKYYIMQLLDVQPGGYHTAPAKLKGTPISPGYNVYVRWGRVGENRPGQTRFHYQKTKDAAISDFKKRFRTKSGNSWDSRDNFRSMAGKYDLVEVDHSADKEALQKAADALKKLDGTESKRPKQTVAPSKLNRKVQELMKVIFKPETFITAMAEYDIDTEKLPLGQLSQSQIEKGHDALDEIEQAIANGSKAAATEGSSNFYTAIPHNFGRRTPPIIFDDESLQKKRDMLNMLSDIEKALEMLEKTKAAQASGSSTTTASTSSAPRVVRNPVDVNYEQLKTDIEVLDESSHEYKVITKFLNNTKKTGRGGWGKNFKSLRAVYRISRHGEENRFSKYDKMTNRKLLWHGTNVAVVAAILQQGCRIMPHSGGRVGRGLYFASEHEKSSHYVTPTGKGVGIMFLNEVPLGREHHIVQDNPMLRAPPSGYDSIVAQGQTEPDPSDDEVIEIDGHEVIVPAGKAKERTAYRHSWFEHTEYLVYNEAQNRIRYLLEFQF